MSLETPSKTQIIVALIGLMGAVSVALIANYYGGSKTIPGSPSPTPTVSITPPINSNNTPLTTITPTPSIIKPDKLIEIIKQQQGKTVRESHGEEASQNFSESDLANFIKEKKTTKIAEELKRDNEFIDIVFAIKAMPRNERQKLLERASNTYKPTWAQLGKIDPHGQTEAGQKAERMIADTVVNLVKELSTLSDEDIKKLYT